MTGIVKKTLISKDANDHKYLKSSGLCTVGLLKARDSIAYKLQVEEPLGRDLNQPLLKSLLD